AGNGPTGFPNVDSDDLGGLFEQLFGRASGGRTRVRATPRKGADLEQPVEITLEEAFNGTQRTFPIRDTHSGAPRTDDVKLPPGRSGHAAGERDHARGPVRRNHGAAAARTVGTRKRAVRRAGQAALERHGIGQGSNQAMAKPDRSGFLDADGDTAFERELPP